MRQFVACLIVMGIALVSLFAVAQPNSAAENKRVPVFSFKDLSEQEHSLSDDEFKNKKLVIAAFTTWNAASIRQARELQKFHTKNTGAVVIAFVVQSVAEARDFVKQEGLTYGCYKVDAQIGIQNNFGRLFETKKGKNLNMNRVPFVIVTDKNRNVKLAKLGLTDSASIEKAIKDAE